MSKDDSVALGSTESYPLPGVTALIRTEPHGWGRDDKGALVQGCFRTGAIYLPTGTLPATAAVTPPDTGINKAIGWLTAGSLVIGIGATLAS